MEPNQEPEKKESNNNSNDQITAMMEMIASMEKKIVEMAIARKPVDEKPKDDDIINRVRAEKEKEDNSKVERLSLENAVKFNYEVGLIVEKNKDLLPPDLIQILEAAKNEKYDSVIHNANETKRILIQSFFSVQENIDLLTDIQKEKVKNYLGLTKEAKLSGAPNIYDNIFQPALSSKEKIKKIEEVAKARLNEKYGYAEGNGAENAHEAKLREISKKYYLGEEK